MLGNSFCFMVALKASIVIAFRQMKAKVLKIVLVSRHWKRSWRTIACCPNSLQAWLARVYRPLVRMIKRSIAIRLRLLMIDFGCAERLWFRENSLPISFEWISGWFFSFSKRNFRFDYFDAIYLRHLQLCDLQGRHIFQVLYGQKTYAFT